MKNILWLASWYPDELNPYNGDFIQRHAFAASVHQPITVVYMAQHGPEKEMPAAKVLVSNHGKLVEMIVYFPYRKTGVKTLDKLRYNWKYFFHFRKFMRTYLAEKGKPDLIHVHIPMKAGRIALWLNKTLRIPYIVTEHSSAYSDEVPDNFEKRNNYYRKWVQLIFENASAVTTVSKKLGDRLSGMFRIADMNIIPNVADTNYFNLIDNKLPRFRFLHASTMDHPKNVEGMLRSLAGLKKVRSDWDCVMLGWDNSELR
ncbi:MAG TPA: glycosyltransferase, partial [Chitinophagaceae bacterium]